MTKKSSWIIIVAVLIIILTSVPVNDQLKVTVVVSDVLVDNVVKPRIINTFMVGEKVPILSSFEPKENPGAYYLRLFVSRTSKESGKVTYSNTFDNPSVASGLYYFILPYQANSKYHIDSTLYEYTQNGWKVVNTLSLDYET